MPVASTSAVTYENGTGESLFIRLSRELGITGIQP